MTLWLLSLLEPNSWPKMCRRLITKSYFTSNCSSLCLGSCRWCVLRRYNSHPFLSRLLQFCLYQLFPMSDLVTKLFASSCSQKYDTHTLCFTCLCILMKHETWTISSWNPLSMETNIYDVNHFDWISDKHLKKMPLTDFCFSHKAFPSPDCECALISD